MGTFQEIARCPKCLRLGQLDYKYGNYECLHCLTMWTCADLHFFEKAFNAGRQYQHEAMLRAAGKNKKILLMVKRLGIITRN